MLKRGKSEAVVVVSGGKVRWVGWGESSLPDPLGFKYLSVRRVATEWHVVKGTALGRARLRLIDPGRPLIFWVYSSGIRWPRGLGMDGFGW